MYCENVYCRMRGSVNHNDDCSYYDRDWKVEQCASRIKYVDDNCPTEKEFNDNSIGDCF